MAGCRGCGGTSGKGNKALLLKKAAAAAEIPAGSARLIFMARGTHVPYKVQGVRYMVTGGKPVAVRADHVDYLLSTGDFERPKRQD